METKADIINQMILDEYWITLVQCPECWMIHSSHDSKDTAHQLFPTNKWWIDCRCWKGFFHHEAPDLFY